MIYLPPASNQIDQRVVEPLWALLDLPAGGPAMSAGTWACCAALLAFYLAVVYQTAAFLMPGLYQHERALSVAVATAVTVLGGSASFFSWLQRRTISNDVRRGEDEYLEGVADYLTRANTALNFQDRFYVERGVRVSAVTHRAYFVKRYEAS